MELWARDEKESMRLCVTEIERERERERNSGTAGWSVCL